MLLVCQWRLFPIARLRGMCILCWMAQVRQNSRRLILMHYPDVHWAPSANAKRVNLETVTKAETQTWQAGETFY